MVETAILIAVIVGLAEAIKRAFKLPSRFAPLIAIALGILATVSFSGLDPMVVFQGVVAGLSASGLYSGTRSVSGI